MQVRKDDRANEDVRYIGTFVSVSLLLLLLLLLLLSVCPCVRSGCAGSWGESCPCLSLVWGIGGARETP